MLLDGFHGVVGACRLESAMPTEERTAHGLVHADATDEDRAKWATASRWSRRHSVPGWLVWGVSIERAVLSAAFRRMRSYSAWVSGSCRRTVTTRSYRPGRSCWSRRNASRNRRLIRLRITALPTFRETGQPDASLAFTGKSVNQEGPAADGVALVVDPLELGRSQQASVPGKQVSSAGLLPHGQSRSSSAW